VRSLLCLEDLEIRNAQPEPIGAGVLVWGGRAELRRCLLRNNVFGILSFEPVPGTMLLEDCTLLDNGAGIWGFVSTQVLRTRLEGNWLGARIIGFADLQDVEVTGSGVGWPWGEPPFASGGLILPGGVGRLQRVTVQGNHSTGGTSGIWMEEGPYELTECVSAGNRSQAGPSGIVAVRVMQLTLRSCTSRDNVSRGLYFPVAGLLADRSRVVAQGCTFENNDSGEHGGGVAAMVRSDVQLLGCRILRNRARLKGGGIYASDSQVALDSVAVLANQASGGGGGIAIDPGARITVQRSTLAGNEASGAAALFLVDGTATFEQSIVAFNLGSPALLCFGDVSWRCSDIFGNSDAAFCGRDLGDNLFVDPAFCNFDPSAGVYDVRLQEDSPLLHIPSCGWIGASPVGCKGTLVEAATWSQVKALFR